MSEASVRRPPEPHKRERGAKPGQERGSDRFVSILLSVLVHAVIVGALLWGWWRYRTPPAPPATLAIEGRVVRETPQLRTGTPPSVQAPADQTRIEQQHQAAQAKAAAAAAALAAQAAAAKAAAQKAAEAQAAAQQAAQQAVQKAAADKLAAEQAMAAKAAQEQAQRAAEEKAAEEAKLAAERKARAEAEAKAKVEAAREAQLMAQQMKAEQAERQQEVQSEIQQEEKLDALRHGPAETQYGDLIRAKITRAWIRPASAQPGVTCIVHITQIAGGEVTHVTVENCNGDDAVRQSVQTAAYRASPLPPPPDPALFDPDITVTFAPDQ